MTVKSSKTRHLKKWEYPRDSEITIREIADPRLKRGAYLVTIPAKKTRYTRMRKQFLEKQVPSTRRKRNRRDCKARDQHISY